MNGHYELPGKPVPVWTEAQFAVFCIWQIAMRASGSSERVLSDARRLLKQSGISA